MKTGQIVCNQCKKQLVHPALIDVKLKCRFNLGMLGGHANPRYPGITEGIYGFCEVEIEGDFCDVMCLETYAYNKAVKKDSAVRNVRQNIYFRGDAFTPGGSK